MNPLKNDESRESVTMKQPLFHATENLVRDPAFPDRILACTNYFGTTAVTGFEYAFDTQSPRYRRADVPSTRGGRRASPPIEPRAERAEPDCWSLSQAEFAVYAEPDC